MISHLPLVRHAALEHRGVGRLALHLHFARPLEATDHGIVLGELGAYVLNNKGPALTPEFEGDIVRLSPALDAIRLDDADFKAAARHFGFVPPDGNLPFIGHGQCPGIDISLDDKAMIIPEISPLRH